MLPDVRSTFALRQGSYISNYYFDEGQDVDGALVECLLTGEKWSKWNRKITSPSAILSTTYLIDWSNIEPGPLWWEASDLTTEKWHSTLVALHCM